jgi:hypothetical protein
MARLNKLIAVCALAVASTLAGCSKTLQIDLFNHSGSAATLNLEEGRVQMPLHSEGRARFAYPSDTQGRHARLTLGGCTYVYVLPDVPPFRPVKFPPEESLPMQLESDMSIHLMPDGSEAIGNVSNWTSLQRGGFPLRPVSKEC